MNSTKICGMSVCEHKPPRNTNNYMINFFAIVQPPSSFQKHVNLFPSASTSCMLQVLNTSQNALAHNALKFPPHTFEGPKISTQHHSRIRNHVAKIQKMTPKLVSKGRHRARINGRACPINFLPRNVESNCLDMRVTILIP